MPLAFEVVYTADASAGIGHTVDIAACKGCTQGTVAGNTVSIGVAAGTTAQLLEFEKQQLMQLLRKGVLLPCLHQLPLLLLQQKLQQL
jgi:hypothetical protein